MHVSSSRYTGILRAECRISFAAAVAQRHSALQCHALSQVRHVPPNTPAYAAGIREGDELEGVQGKVFQPGLNALELMKELDGPFQSSVELAIRGGPSAELRQLRLVRAQPEAYEGVLRDALSTLSRASSPLSVQDSPTSVEGGRSMLGRRFSSSDDESDVSAPLHLAKSRMPCEEPTEFSKVA